MVHRSKLHKGHLDWVILNVCPFQSVCFLCGMFRDCGTFGILQRSNQTGVQKFEGNERVCGRRSFSIIFSEFSFELLVMIWEWLAFICYVEVHSSSCSVAFSEGRSILNEVSRPIHRRRSEGLAVRGLFGLGVPELAVIAGVAALVFGPKQLPAIGKSLGQTVKSFQQVHNKHD